MTTPSDYLPPFYFRLALNLYLTTLFNDVFSFNHNIDVSFHYVLHLFDGPLTLV